MCNRRTQPYLKTQAKKKKPKYFIRRTLCSVITLSSIFMMVVGSIFTIVFGLYYRLLFWIDQIVVSSIVLNIEIMAESAALNVQDSLQLNLNDLKIAKAFIEAAANNPEFIDPLANITIMQSFDILSRPSNYTNTSTVSYFVDPMIQSVDNMSVQQQIDLQTAQKNSYLMVTGLTKNYGNMPQVQNWIGFEQGGLSEWPVKKRPYFSNSFISTTNVNCDNGDSSYQLACQSWFQNQQKSPDYPTVGRIQLQGNNSLTFTTCIKLNSGSVNGVLCVEQLSKVTPWANGTEYAQYVDLSLYRQPALIDQQSQISVESQIEIIGSLTAGSLDSYEVQNKITSEIFPQTYLTLGTLLTKNQTSFTKQVQFVKTGISMKSDDRKLADFDLFLFMPQRTIQGAIQSLKKDLVRELFVYWGSYFILSVFVFICCMGIIVQWLSFQITEPIVQLTNKIVLNIKSVQRLKRDTRANQQNKQISFQIDHLLKGFKERNREMNQLYLSFNQMAKVLAVSQDFTGSQDSYQSCFNLLQAIEVFSQFGNLRAEGICYQNLGCLTAKQSAQGDYQRAVSYMMKAIQIQRDIIQQSAQNEQFEQQIKDSVVLACRYFSCGSIIHNYYTSSEMKVRFSDNPSPEALKNLEDAAEKADEFLVLSLQILEGQVQSEGDLIESGEDVQRNQLNETQGYQDFVVFQNILRIELYCLRFPLFVWEDIQLKQENDIENQTHRQSQFKQSEEYTLQERKFLIKRLIDSTRYQLEDLEACPQPQVSRCGLKVFSVDHLRQLLNYVQGLYNQNVLLNEEVARYQYFRSLCGFKTQTNRVALQCGLRIFEIMKKRRAATIVQIANMKTQIKKSNSLRVKQLKPQIPVQNFAQHQEQELKIQKRANTKLDRSIEWVKILLSHHAVESRSIMIILDCRFEHQWLFIKCHTFIKQLFECMQSFEYIGLSSLDREKKSEFQLEKVDINRPLKSMLLDDMCTRAKSMNCQKRRTTIMQSLNLAHKSHQKVQEFQISKFKMSFKSPHKWTILLLGSTLGINQVQQLPESFFKESNVIIVVLQVLNSEEESQLNRVKTSINKKSVQSGVIMVKMPKLDVVSKCPQEIEKSIDEAFTRLKTIMQLYPSNNIQVIEEALNF